MLLAAPRATAILLIVLGVAAAVLVLLGPAIFLPSREPFNRLMEFLEAGIGTERWVGVSRRRRADRYLHQRRILQSRRCSWSVADGCHTPPARTTAAVATRARPRRLTWELARTASLLGVHDMVWAWRHLNAAAMVPPHRPATGRLSAGT